jgi:hypothetical protein
VGQAQAAPGDTVESLLRRAEQQLDQNKKQEQYRDGT